MMVYPGEKWRRIGKPQYDLMIISVGYKVDICPDEYLTGHDVSPYELVAEHQYGFHYVKHIEIWCELVRSLESIG